MPQPTVSTEHSTRVRAPAPFIHDMLTSVEAWPEIFPSFVHLALLDSATPATNGIGWERIEVWTQVDGTIDHWGKRRAVHPKQYRIDFQPESPMPLLTSMQRSFLVEPAADNDSLVRLRHEYRTVDDHPDTIAAVNRGVENIAQAELAALKAAAEPLATRADLRLVFGETVLVQGAASDVYDFLWNAAQWSEGVPHVAAVSVREEHLGRQLVEMDTVEAKGGTLRTRMARIGFPHSKIAFKHLALPPLGRAHLGHWSVANDSPGTTSVTVHHRVVLDEAGVAQMLGPDTALDVAAAFARKEITTKNRLILEAAKAYAERKHSHDERH